MTLVLIALPPFMGVLVRLAIAVISDRFPGWDIRRFYPLILGTVAAMVPYFNGLLAGLLLLEERDQGISPALRVTPLSDRGILLAKALPAAALAALGTPAALYLTGLYKAPLGITTGISLLAALQTLFGIAILLLFARTKVQGLAVGKLMGFGLLAPALWFFVPATGRFTALIFPAGWFAAAIAGHRPAAAVLTGFLYHVVLIVALESAVRRRYLGVIDSR